MTNGGAVRLAAPAKVNLNLNITGKREDGYHLLDSIVVFTTFGDHLEVTPAEADIVTIGGHFANSLSAAGDNICLHALSAYRAAGGAVGPLAIHIDKQIPVGAGLGGGSSDAAAILRHLNTISSTPLSEDQLAAVALTIGADVPVCLAGTAQRMQGIGENLSPVIPEPHGHLVLARPDAMLATGDVFRHWRQTGSPNGMADIGRRPEQIMADGNDLQQAAISLVPAIGLVLDHLQRCDGAIAAQMSGSGSACFGLFADATFATQAAKLLTDKGLWAVSTQF